MIRMILVFNIENMTEADLLSFAEFLHIIGETLHAVLSQLQMGSFLEFRLKKGKG